MGSNHNGNHDPRWYLQRVSLFAALTEIQRQTVQDSARMVDLRRRQRIYGPGDPDDHLFMLKSGIVKLSVTSPEGREIILGFVYPGDVFGELAIVDDGPHDHIAEAYEDAVVSSIDRDVLKPIMLESPRFAHGIMQLLAARQRAYRTRVEELLYKSAHARVAHTLLDLAGQHGVQDDQGVVIPLRLSQRDIANLVGLTRETVNFILKDLRQRNVIETQGRSIRVLSPNALHAAR